MPRYSNRASFERLVNAQSNRNSKLVVTSYKSNFQGWVQVADKKCFFRSKWEVYAAFTFDFYKRKNLIKDWAYEELCLEFSRIKYKTGPYRYLIDYTIYNNDGSVEYVEIKGYQTPDTKKKLKRTKADFPAIKLTVYDGEWFKAARKKGWHRLMGWPDLPDMQL